VARLSEWRQEDVIMERSVFRRRSLWLLLPPTALCVLDFGLTLYGQPDAYWQGNLNAVNELSPSFAGFLSMGPPVFIAAILLWIAIYSILIVLLPERLALTLVIAIVLGHMTGAASWLAYRFQLYQACCALFLTTSALIVFAFKRGQNADGRAAFDWQRTGLPEWLRWIVIAVLIALPIWWFLIPR
jgi:hypothetical protein